MNRFRKRLLGWVFAGVSISSLLGCELIVQLDSALVDSGADDTGATLYNCSICDPDASLDASDDADAEVSDAPRDAVGERPVEDSGTLDAKTADAKSDAADAKPADAKAAD